MNSRILLDDAHEGRQLLPHGCKRNRLIGLDETDDAAVVLLRKETFRNNTIQIYINQDCYDQSGKCDPFVIQRPTDGGRVTAVTAIKKFLAIGLHDTDAVSDGTQHLHRHVKDTMDETAQS